MNTKTLITCALSATLAVVGCVSVDLTRTQLASSNPQEVQKAKENVFAIATTGKDPLGLIELTINDQVQYVDLVTDNALLLRIIDNARQDEVVVAAANKMDFSKQGIGPEVLKRMERILGADRNLGSRGKKAQLGDEYIDKVLKAFSEQELRGALTDYRGGMYKYREKISERLIDVTKDVDLLLSLYDGDLRGAVANSDRDNVIVKLASMSDALTNSEVITKVLEAKQDGRNKTCIQDLAQRQKLLSRLSDEDAVKFVLSELSGHNVYRWNDGDLVAFDDAIVVSSTVKDAKSVVEIVTKVIAKLSSYKAECKNSWTMSWTDEDASKAKEITGRFQKFDDETTEALMCADGTGWQYFIDAVSSSVAYNILSGGKSKSGDLELALLKKIPDSSVDMKVYNGVKFANTRKSVYERMSDEMKKTAADAKEKSYKDVCEKAKTAAAETFALDGFYLGMSFEDMKTVFAYLFPDLEIKEDVDGEGKDADHVIYVPGQQSPVCYANVGDGKVYQFNFGKKLLKKWYKYDVQTFAEWAHTYARENGIDMVLKFVEKDTTVYEPMGTRSYRVWFHQESYQYKHNTKEYRLTYFGEEKDFTFEGGLGGAVIKEMAAPRFRYVRGDPGSLRVRIERD